MLKLLDGRYPNISIEIDPELEADLRQAIRKAEAENAGDDAAVIRAALETALGSTITFRYLGEGQKGNTAFDLVFYAGSDPDKAAQAAYSQWNPILSNVPADGKYDTSLAMVETNSGVWMLVKATVEKAGSRDDGPDPVTLKSLSVTGPSQTEYIKGQPFNPAGMTVTAHYSDGSFKPIAAGEYTIVIDDKEVSSSYQFDRVGSHTLKVKYNEMVSTNSVSIWVADENGYHEDNGNYVVTGSNGLQELYDDLTEKGDTFSTAKITLESPVTLDANWKGEEISFSGELNGNGNTITMKGNRSQGLFDVVGEINKNVGTVKDLTIQVDGNINVSDENFAVVGVVAGTNYGSISNCTVTVNGSITAASTVTGDENTFAAAGGIAGRNSYGTIEHCDVTISGSITATASSTSTDDTIIADANAGGIVGYNVGTIKSSCSVELNGGSIQATATGRGCYAVAHAGGIAGYGFSKGVECDPATGTGTIKATVTSTSTSSSGGSVTLTLNSNTVTVEPKDAHNAGGNTYFVGYARAGTKTA